MYYATPKLRITFFVPLLVLCLLFAAPLYAEEGNSWETLVIDYASSDTSERTYCWDLSEYSSGNFGRAQSENSEEGMLVTVFEENLAWGEYFTFPQTIKNKETWQATLTVADKSPQVNVGLLLRNDTVGFLFQTDGSGEAQLRLSVSDVETSHIQSFSHAPLTLPFTITLRYNSTSGELVGGLADQEIFRVTLPYYGIPAISRVQHAEIETISPHHYRGAWALYESLSVTAW